mmetsp:Transcript_43222/g.103773  ORF Transcript_43222/g.103773 Transcript_43222/m.103773 type:complete len:230 (-) Transcript_43222:5-694(-)
MGHAASTPSSGSRSTTTRRIGATPYSHTPRYSPPLRSCDMHSVQRTSSQRQAYESTRRRRRKRQLAWVPCQVGSRVKRSAGRVNSAREEQWLKARSPMVARAVESVNLVSLLQPQKAPFPMMVTVAGRVSWVREVQCLKVPAGMATKSSGKRKCGLATSLSIPLHRPRSRQRFTAAVNATRSSFCAAARQAVEAAAKLARLRGSRCSATIVTSSSGSDEKRMLFFPAKS